MVTAALVTTLAYLLRNREDDKDFKETSTRVALIIQDSLAVNLALVVEAMSGLSDMLSSETENSASASWPFVSLSSFEVFVQHTRVQTGSELLVVCPIVDHHHLQNWSQYSTEHQNWISTGFRIQNITQSDLNPIPSSVYRFGTFKGKKALIPEDGNDDLPAAPFWQMSPPPFDTSIVNHNALSNDEYRQNYATMLLTRGPVIGRAQKNFLIDYAISQEDHDALHGNSSSSKVPGYADDHPHSSIIYPVFEKLHDPSSRIVALIAGVLSWDSYLQRLLPEGVNGVYCILRNSCGQDFTYKVYGQYAKYLGPGDLHDKKYDEHEHVIFLDEIIGDNSLTLDQDASNGSCRYRMSVFPSQELEKQHQSKTPALFTGIVALCFLVMSLTFAIYDFMVVRKTKKLEDTAVQSGAIISVSTQLFVTHLKEYLTMQSHCFLQL